MIDINTGTLSQSGEVEVSDKDLLNAIHLSEQKDLGVTPIQYSTSVAPKGPEINFQDTEKRYKFLQTYVFDWKGNQV